MSDPEPAEQAESAPGAWLGYVLFLPHASGTKSEGVRSYLISCSGECPRLYCPGDNPFVNESIRALHRCYCEVQGQFDETKNLIHVSNITEEDDPLQSPSE